MVRESFKPVFFCKICKQKYSSKEEAEKCESQGLQEIEYLIGTKVNVTNSPSRDGFVKIAGGIGSVNLDIYREIPFNVINILIEKKTHENFYLIRAVPDEGLKKHVQHVKKMLIEESKNPDKRDETFSRMYERANKLSDEEYLENYCTKFLLPAWCIFPFNGNNNI